MAHIGPNRIYVCGRNAYDNELAMVRHEGVHHLRDGAVERVIEPRPRFAYRITEGDAVRWATDPVDVYLARRQSPNATIDVVAVRR
jgi:hypothetical protein